MQKIGTGRMEVIRNRGRERKIWTEEAEEDMMLMGIKMEGVEEDFTGSQCTQGTVGHEEEEEEEGEEEKKKKDEEEEKKKKKKY